MKKYKKLIEDQKEYFKGYNDRWIISTTHSIQRYVERYSNQITDSIFYNVINNSMKKIIHDYKDKEGVYGYHSISTGIGGIINWRKDFKNINDKKNHAVLVSLFPLKKFHNFSNVNAKFLIEQQLICWAEEKGFKPNKRFSESYFDKQFYIEDEVYINFYEGELYQTELAGYIIVE